MGPSPENADSLSVYETLRAQRIHKNRERMSELKVFCLICNLSISAVKSTIGAYAGAFGIETSATSLQTLFKVQKKPGKRQAQVMLPS